MKGMSTDLTRLTPDLRKAVTGELMGGERVIYAAMPDWRSESGKLAVIFSFGFFWSMLAFPAGFFVWAEALGFRPEHAGQAMGSGLALFFSIFMIPFVVIGAVLLAAPFIAALRTSRTAHVITDQRLFSVTHGNGRVVESIKLDVVNFVKRRDGKDGRGSLSIGYGVEKDSDGDARPLTMDWSGIADVKRAEATIRSVAGWAR